MISDRVTSNQMSQHILENIGRANRRMGVLQEQIASGYRINRPSDDPTGTVRSMGFKSDLVGMEQYQKNVSYADSWVNVTDTALSQITSSMMRVRDLVVQASNDTLSPTDRLNLVEEMKGLAEDLKVIGNTQHQGVYIFGGTQTAAVPYSVGGADAYVGNTGSITREIGPNVRLNVNLVGQQVIGDNASGPLMHLRNLISHLSSGTPADLDLVRTTDLQDLDGDLQSLSQLRTSMGALQSRLDLATDRMELIHENTTKLLSETRDTDIAATYIKYTQEQASYQAALRTGASVVQPSLMDFLG